MEIASIVAAGGGKYVGVLKAIPGRFEMLILFISPKTKTTLTLPISHLTSATVRKHLAESNAAFTRPTTK